ncbi:MAG: alpha-mannosidase [Armatimonadota bacterium]|jgi:alpha-mannosidase
MSFDKQFELAQHKLNQSRDSRQAILERFRIETDFAAGLAKVLGKEDWKELILKAIEHVNKQMTTASFDCAKAVGEAEAMLAPIGEVAKTYTIHVCGHAHIDMNWMWNWPETVNVTHDTFTTMNQLMDDFPEYTFSQSQASTYFAMEQYCPEIFEMIKKRVKEGRWEITASTWVEGEKNFVSGESLCRHFLYTRQYMKDRFGLDPEDIKIDWSPDTFGHAHTVPSILSRAGVNRYYLHRTAPHKWLFKWRSPDGSEIYVFKDRDKYVYNGPIDPADMAAMLISYTSENGLKDYLYVYGVGDHGGGPTRRDLRKFREICSWPIFPTVKHSSTRAYFDAIEKANADLPVVDEDLNFTFEGCYTSQSNIKRATRISEIILPEAETMALIAASAAEMDYPFDTLFTAWRHTLFNHFHDILPGSGVHSTYEYSQGLFQEIQAAANTISTRALRKLGSKIDTSFAAPTDESIFGAALGDGLGAGAGDPAVPGRVTGWNAGALSAEPVLVYNQKPWDRSETVYAKVWNKPIADDRVIVKDADGNAIRGQVVGRGHYWAHEFTTIAFNAEVPALGYKVYAIDSDLDTPAGGAAKIDRKFPDGTESMIVEINESGVMENEYLRVELDFPSGAIKHLIDKETGYDYVPEGKLMGVIEAYTEVHHGMSAWVIGQIAKVEPLVQGGKLYATQRGPNRVAFRSEHKYNESSIAVEIGLNAGSRQIDFKLNMRWVEIGTPERGVPMLRAAFPVNVENGTPRYEIPFGSQTRQQSKQEIPALKWADVSDEKRGLTLVNDCKYGHSCVDNTLRLTLIRSSYDPDALPEVADHEIKFAITPHSGSCDISAATKLGEQFNSPMAIASTGVQKGDLPASKSFVEVLTPGVFCSTVKKAEDGSGVVLRLFDMEGKSANADVRITDLVKPNSSAVEVDILERPVAKNTAKMSGEVVSVTIPAYGQATVKVG